MTGTKPSKWLARCAVFACTLFAAVAIAFAAAEEKLKEARRELEASRPFLKASADPDAEQDARKDARREARTHLLAARDAYQTWQGANTKGDDEPFDPVGKDIAAELFWLNKMSSSGEVGAGGRAKPAPVPTDKPPVSDKQPPAPTDKPPTPPAGETPKPVPATVPPAAADPAAQRKRDFEDLLVFDRRNKSDPPAVKEAYEKFLAAYPDPGTAEYAQAVLRVSQIADDLNTTFRKVAQQDPGALDTSDANAANIVRLKNEFNSKDPEARLRAAKMLGLTRSGAAASVLVYAIVDDDANVASASQESLVAIGGKRTGEMIVKRWRDGSDAGQRAALDVLMRIAKKDPVDAAAMSFWLGRFVLCNDQKVAGDALDFLVSMGPAGGPGLVEALEETKMALKKVALMDAIAKARYYKGTRQLTHFLVRKGGYINQAKAAIKAMGDPAVPYLLYGLRNGPTNDHTALLLREITGATLLSNNIQGWVELVESRYGKEDKSK